MIELLGTSHIAAQSIAQVRKKILELPDIVAVELDKERYFALKQGRRKAGFSAIRRVGLIGYLFAKFGGWLQRRLGRQAGVFPGAEMIGAVEAAREAGLKVAFIDRPLSQTLRSLSLQMPLAEKLKLVLYLLFGFGKKVEFDLAKVPEEKTIAGLSRVLKTEFPVLYKVLVTERDKWMARQLFHLNMRYKRSKILAVIGAGHVRGVRKCLGEFERNLRAS